MSRSLRRLGPVLLPLVLPLAAMAADAPARWEAEAGFGRETLSTDVPAWRQTDLALRRRAADGTIVELTGRSASRYGETDRELGAALVQPFGDWALGLRAFASDAPAFLPRLGGELELSRRLPGGWVLGASAGRRLFPDTELPGTGSSTLSLGAEWYAGAWRLAGAATGVRLDGGASGTGWRLQVDRFVGETGRIGLIVGGGDEIENAPGGVLLGRSEAVVLVGQWPVAPGWTLVGDIGRTRVRDLERRTDAGTTPAGPGYSRRGGRLGVRVEF